MRHSILLATIVLGIVVGIVLVVASPSSAQVSHNSLVSREVARQFGLERPWYTHVELDPARSEVAHVLQHISSTKGHTEFEVLHGELRFVVSERELDAFGEPLGVERAKEKAEQHLAELQAAGGDASGEAPQLITHVIPEITLFVATDKGVLHAIDGETGRTRWATQAGRRNHPTREIGANDRYVGLVNGSMLYVIDAESGEVQWSRQTVGVPGAGPALSDSLIHVPTITGALEAYDLEDPLKPALITKAHGKCLVQPTATPNVVAWPTERGHLYVADSSRQEVRYRLEAKDTIVSPAAYSAERGVLLATSVDGYLYCVAERNGAILWRYSTGQPISASPVPIGDRVYIVTDEFNLFCISLDDGAELWLTPRISQFIAESRDRIFCADQRGQLTILARESGGRIGAAPTQRLDLMFANSQTDRIFLGSSAGIIQCLHATEERWPLVHAGVGELGKEKKEEETPMDAAAPPMDDMPPAAAPANDSPFGGANPFEAGGAGAAGNDAPPAAENPFENPFQP